MCSLAAMNRSFKGSSKFTSQCACRLVEQAGRQVTLRAHREQKLQHIGAYINKLRNRLLAVCGDLLGGEHQVEGSIVDHRGQRKRGAIRARS